MAYGGTNDSGVVFDMAESCLPDASDGPQCCEYFLPESGSAARRTYSDPQRDRSGAVRSMSDSVRPSAHKFSSGRLGEDSDFQGPHDWRKRLKPVLTSPDRPSTLNRLFKRKKENESMSERRMSCDERVRSRPVMTVARKDHMAARQKECRSPPAHSDAHSLCPGKRGVRLHKEARESDFTRQIVKHSIPSGILRPQGSMRRTTWLSGLPSQSDGLTMSVHDIKRCIEKAQKARLYLLRQTGPNSFLIGGDSPDHKYRVTIGEQKCSCGRSVPCVHVLFVMLRVFQLPETDPKLLSKKLKNFEVETLLRQLSERRLHHKVKTPTHAKTENLLDNVAAQPASPVESNNNEHGKDEEDEEEICSICLLEMVEGESLMVCKNGCQNRLHHHCITRWFEECRQEHKPIHCPLCQAPWQNENSSVQNEQLVPSVQRSPSPNHISAINDLESIPLEPIPDDCHEMAEKWSPVLGDEIVVRLFSRNWVLRELGLRMMGKEAVTMLLRGVGEGRSGLQVSSAQQANTHTMLECCFSVLAYTLADPVYKVFVAGLRSLRLILLYTPCRDVQQQSRLQSLISPIVKTLLFKCADSNRRMSQLSIDALLEMVKGDEGELPVGREIVSPGALGLGGVDFVLSCIVEAEEEAVATQWQSLLGRLYMLDRLTDEHADDFRASLRVHRDGDNPVTTDPRANYDRAFSILRFCARHMTFGHAKVAKMVHRVFYNVAALQVTVGGTALVEQVCFLLDGVDTHIRLHMRRKLKSVAGDHSSVVRASREELHTGSGNGDVVFFVSAHPTPPVESVADSSGAVSPCVLGTQPVDTRPAQDCTSLSIAVNSAMPVLVAELDANLTAAAEKPVMMIDACVATSPSLRRHRVRRTANDSDTSADEMNGYSVIDVRGGRRPRRLISSLRSDSLESPHRSLRRPLSTPVNGSAYAGNSCSLSCDLSDLNLTSSASDDRVSFKKEVASTPNVTPPGTADNSNAEQCHCKEEVEKEEAQALAAAMERSTLKQDALPFVPGLSRELSETTLTIHIQDEGHENSDHIYREDVHWKRGPIIGTGAFSTCYQARDIHTGTLMTVKQISFCRNTTTEQERVVEAVRREIDIMSKFNHPNIVRILGATQKGFHFFMFLEWMPGCTIEHLLDKYGAFSDQCIANYTEQILRGLAYLHENNTMHRDLKGANILVDSTGHRVRIGDFGACAKLASQATGAGEFEGQLLGTIAFMAPEVLRGASYGRSCDIWSVGCVMIQMVTTKPPWGASGVSNHLALIYKIGSTQVPPNIPENLFPPLRDMMIRCLEVSPEDRPLAKDLLKHPLFTMARR